MMASDYTQLGAALVDLRAAYPDRLAEAIELSSSGSGRFGTAIALGLYALEIYLKVRICERLDLDQLPRAFQIHHLDGLLVLSGLKRRMENLGTHPVKANWNDLASLGLQHVNEMRYKPNSNWNQSQAVDLLAKIQDPRDGVLSWLSAQP